MTPEDKLRLKWLAKKTGLSQAALQTEALERLYSSYLMGIWRPRVDPPGGRTQGSRADNPNTHGRTCACNLCQITKGDTV